MYKEAKGVVTSYLLYLWLLLLATLCILLSSEASTYYNSYNHPAAVQMMRARPYYVAPRPPATDNHPNGEVYPVPPRAVSSYAAPLVVMSANYQPTPASKVPPTTYKPALPTVSDPEIPSSISNNNEETNYSESNVDDVTEVSLVPEVATTYSSDDETTYWILETSHSAVPYEGTTHAPIYLPALTSSI